MGFPCRLLDAVWLEGVVKLCEAFATVQWQKSNAGHKSDRSLDGVRH